MSTILVTGATGNVGRQVVRALLERGRPVRALVRDAERARALLGPDVELAVGDYADPAPLRRAMRGAVAVFLTSADNPHKVEHECAVIDAASVAWIERIVKLSSPHVELGSDLGFWDRHARIERHLRGSGVAWTIMRGGFFMSNLVASVDQAASTGVLAAPAGDARIAMVDPADIGEVAAVLLTSPDHAGRVYAVTGGTAVTYHEVAAAFSSALGRRITFADVPDDAAMRALLDSGAPEWLASDLVTLFGKLRAGACATATDSVRELTGRPARTLADWAREHLTSSAVPALADAANAVGPTQLP